MACLPLPFICLPLLFICLPLLFNCLPVLFICLSGWVLVVGFPAGLSPTSFHLSPRLGACGRVPGRLVSLYTSFHLSPTSFLVVGFLAGLSSTSFHISLPGLPGCLWSGSRLACLPLPCICLPFPFICLPLLFICLPGWVLVVGFAAGLSPTSLH